MSEFKHIVRISGKTLDGTKKVVAGLADIKGIGLNLASCITDALKIDGKMTLGMLSDKQVMEIQDYIKEPNKLGIPKFMLNHKKDPESGVDSHYVATDLDVSIKSEIDREKLLLSWRGYRHSLGLKVRGQRTRTCGRKGRAVGVRKS